jgi:hydroxyacylglutathione hydrolase
VWLTEGHLNGHISLIFWRDPASGEELMTPSEGDEAALFCGDTLFAAGCGRVFDGPMERMYQSLKRFSDLPLDTLVFPAHEYTLDNLRFARYAMPDHRPIDERLARCEEVRAEGRATLPSDIAHERATNPFILASSLEHFVELRTSKDRGAHRA